MKQHADKYDHPIGALFTLPDDRKLPGQITLRRGKFSDSAVRLVDDELFDVPDGASLHGMSEEGRVSLLRCFSSRFRHQFAGDRVFYTSDLSFQYATFGDRHLDPNDRVILSIRFAFDEIDTVLTDRDADVFGHISNPHEDIIDAIEQRRPDYLKGDLSRDGSATVSYFTGQFEVLPATETELGTVRGSRTVFGDLSGREIKDIPYLTIDFDDRPATLDEAFQKMRAVRQFFGWMIGYAPRWREVSVFTFPRVDDGYRADDEGNRDVGLEVFSPIEWQSAYYDERNRGWPGALIDLSREPEHFANTMREWLRRNRDGRREGANAKFFKSMPGIGTADAADGICSAANMFDLLPAEDKPSMPSLSAHVDSILRGARMRIRELDDLDTEEREEVLSGIGRIRAHVGLRDIIERRANVVLEHAGEERLPNIQDVVRAAVICRNYYTHGTEVAGIDCTDMSVVMFLTRTLEVIYGVSELIQCGWDVEKWFDKPGMSHPFEKYMNSYRRHLTMAGLA